MSIEDDQQFEQIHHQEEQVRLSKEYHDQTLAFIDECLDAVGKMGANDSEPGEILKLRQDFLDGKIRDEEARKFASKIVQDKNAYH